MLLLVPCGLHLARGRRAPGGPRRGRATGRAPARSAGARSSPSTRPRTSAGPGRASSTASRSSPRSSTRPRSSTSPPPGAGCRSSDALRPAGAARRAATVRLPVVRTDVAARARPMTWRPAPGSARTASGKAGDNPFLRFRLHEAVRQPSGRAPGGSDGRSDAARADRRGHRRPPRQPCPPRPSSCRTTRPGPRSTTTGTCGAAATPTAPSTTCAWQMELDAATTWLDGLPLARRDRRAGGGHRLVVGPARDEGRAARLRRRRRAARPGPRPARRAPPAGSPPRPRCMGGARPRRGRPLRRVLAEPRAPRAAGGVPRDRPSVAEAGGAVRGGRLPGRIRRRAPGRPAAGAWPGSLPAPARRWPRVHDPEGPLHAGRAARPPCATAGFVSVDVRTTGRFFVLVTARRPRPASRPLDGA